MTQPTILVIDDLFGRSVRERRNLCKAYRLQDVTGDDPSPIPLSEEPVARAVFCSGQHSATDRQENSVATILDAVRSGWPDTEGNRWSLCLLDLRFVSGLRGDDGICEGQEGDDDFGLLALGELQREFPQLPVVILSSRDRAEVIQKCRQLGACDFIQRHDATAKSAHAVLAKKLHDFGLITDTSGAIVGRSVPLLQALAAARRAATGSGNILLLGESGTGKELVARYIHDNSPLSQGPYKVFDAFGTAESLQEDLLFGHERGAYTGAQRERRGLFEEAQGGTLFIDEVGEISSAVQNRLLRPIESRTIARQGSSAAISLSFQLVLATNKDLDEHARTGQFKSDLLNRINAYTIWLPPIRERRDDIPLMATVLLERLCLEHGLRWPRHIDSDAMHRLVEYDWRDGNVRELRSTLERAAKDNRDGELLVAGDLTFPSTRGALLDSCRPSSAARGIPDSAKGNDEGINHGYEELFGSWLPLQRNAATQLLVPLCAALRATARRNPGDGSARPNLAGAVGCLLGRKVSSVEAADFIKRIVRLDPDVADELGQRHPILAGAIEQALRARPASASRLARKSLEDLQ